MFNIRRYGTPVLVAVAFTATASGLFALDASSRSLNPLVEAFEETIVRVVETSTPSVVAISARDVRPASPVRRLTEEERIPLTSGSGFLYRADGYVLTNSHVVDDAQAIEVRLMDDRKFDATLVGIDRATDVAVLKVTSETPFPVLPLADAKSIRVGQFALSIGNPFSLDFSVNIGIVSAKGRADMLPRDVETVRYQDFIQTDAYINRGNSGGPLLNLRGEVIGMNTMIRTDASAGFSGIGFAIPPNILSVVADQLIANGEVRRGWLGILLRGDDQGVRISRVLKNSPAEKSGLLRDDVIAAVDGESIGTTEAFRWRIANALAGTRLRLDVLREGAPIQLDVVVGDMPPEIAGKSVPERTEPAVLTRLGLTGQTLPEALTGIHGFDSADTGYFITRVEPGSAAHRAGLLPGELIVSANGMAVKSADECEAIVRSVVEKNDKTIRFTIKSAGETRTVEVALDAPAPTDTAPEPDE
jgi:S1-C subfamily serine protease